MAIASDDLLAPRGEIEPALFPGETGQALSERLEGYITEGYTNADLAGHTDPVRQDAIARFYAYFRAYNAAIQRIVANPTTVAFNDKGSSSYSSEQLRILLGEAERWRTAYGEALADLPIDNTPVTGPVTGATLTRFRF